MFDHGKETKDMVEGFQKDPMAMMMGDNPAEPTMDEMFEPSKEDKKTMAFLVESVVKTEAEVSIAKKRLAVLKDALIGALLEQGQPDASGIVNGVKVKLKIGNTLRFTRKKSAEMSDVVQWLRDNGLGDIVKTDPYAETATIKSAVREALGSETMTAEDVPTDLFSMFDQPSLTYSSGKSQAFATFE